VLELGEPALRPRRRAVARGRHAGDRRERVEARLDLRPLCNRQITFRDGRYARMRTALGLPPLQR
jgi:hypothetical protein